MNTFFKRSIKQSSQDLC